MQPRKAPKRMSNGKGRIRRAGKMFPKAKLARSIKIRATPDDVSVGLPT